MTARAEKDRHIRLGILRWAYANFLEAPGDHARAEELLGTLNANEVDVAFITGRLAEKGLIDQQLYSGTQLGDIRLKASGIETLSEEGDKTILDDDTRYRLLKVLYEAKRKDPHWGHVDVEMLAKEVGGEQKLVEATLWYIADADLADLNHDAVITGRGIDAYEAYVAHGLEGVRDIHDMWQVTIGPNAREQAVNLFRDITELATHEIVVIDRYARAPIFDMLGRVPKGVAVKILTEETVTKAPYAEVVAKARAKVDLEVRSIPKDSWDFHGRYLLTDRNSGWVWDHSFHDAGETQHTVSSMKPVNRNKVLEDFDAAWSKAAVVG